MCFQRVGIAHLAGGANEDEFDEIAFDAVEPLVRDLGGLAGQKRRNSASLGEEGRENHASLSKIQR
ncbi:MAG: hypothetical protein R3C31_13010 [Hyphomonadaceae bacterium]